MNSYATLLSGGDGFGVGAVAAGLKSSWGVEIDGSIADWAERNNPELSVIRASVTDVDYASLESPWLLHASTQCKRASNANQQGESEEDMAQADGVILALQVLLPPVFTLENVWGYRKFQAFKSILQALSDLGYKADFWHMNAADYGVPQTRKRLILIARRDRYPTKPVPTHTNLVNIVPGQPGMFGDESKPWVGWYEAIEDLIPGLPDTEFALWQVERLERDRSFLAIMDGEGPGWKKGTEILVAQGGYDGGIVTRADGIPANTLTANHNQNGLNALLVPGDNASSHTTRDADEPAVTAVTRRRSMARIFVVDDQNGSLGKDGSRGLMIRRGEEPMNTVMATKSKPSRVYLSGRVVKLTVRALARLQSVPDWYELPKSDSLACTIIGNMVPPLLAQKIVESAND